MLCSKSVINVLNSEERWGVLTRTIRELQTPRQVR